MAGRGGRGSGDLPACSHDVIAVVQRRLCFGSAFVHTSPQTVREIFEKMLFFLMLYFALLSNSLLTSVHFVRAQQRSTRSTQRAARSQKLHVGGAPAHAIAAAQRLSHGQADSHRQRLFPSLLELVELLESFEDDSLARLLDLAAQINLIEDAVDLCARGCARVTAAVAGQTRGPTRG